MKSLYYSYPKIFALIEKSFALSVEKVMFRNMLIIVLLLPFLSIFASADYIPGSPGAPWTKYEVLTVKSKLYSIFARKGGANALKQIYGKNPSGWVDVPNAPKFLRLGFHDCLKYVDGSGGCDGCLNWKGVDFRFDDAPDQFKYEDVSVTNNNNLQFTVEVLEHIYTDPEFPKVTLQ